MRGYFEGDAYGDAGWSGSLELRSPFVKTRVATIHSFAPTWLHAAVFVDYGERFLLDPPGGASPVRSFLGTGFGLTADINNYVEARVSVAWPAFPLGQHAGRAAGGPIRLRNAVLMRARRQNRRTAFPGLRWLATASLAAGIAPVLRANPNGMTVTSGSASAVASGSQLNVTATSGAVLNWQSFNINAGETTIFQEPSATSVVYNNINGQNPSQIWGNLQANGIVVLENRSGFYFGPNAVVTAPGFVASTAAVTPQDMGSGAFWQFTGPPPRARIVNYGQINAGPSGSIFLIADKIENHGNLTAPDGSIGLVAGQQVMVSDSPDGRGLSAQVTLPSGSVDNTGRIVADAGTIALRAQVVNQNGIIQADSVREQNGVVELVATQDILLGPDSQISASGGVDGVSSGGSVQIQSGGNFSDTASSMISVAGGSQGGKGGAVEISAPQLSTINSQISGEAVGGYQGGQLLIDPTEIVIGTSGSGTVPGSGTVLSGDPPGTLNLNVNSSFQGFSQITLQASDDITFANNTSWNLSASTGLSTGQLVLEAGNNIIFGNNTSVTTPTIYDTGNWSVSLAAGMNFTTGTVQPGIGSIFLNGGAGLTQNGSIQTASGSIALTAGQDILVGGGFMNTTHGGGITADALAGSINAGTLAAWRLHPQFQWLCHTEWKCAWRHFHAGRRGRDARSRAGRHQQPGVPDGEGQPDSGRVRRMGQPTGKCDGDRRQ